MRRSIARDRTIGDESFGLRAGELIRTEHSHKYDVADFSDLAASAGFRVSTHWTDPRRMFAVMFLEVE